MYASQVPSVAQMIEDWIKPLFAPPERDCLSYLARRVQSISSEAITLKQFEYGQTVGRYLRDLGCGLKRPTIKKALENLEMEGLVEAHASCSHCFWETAPGTRVPKECDCPHCQKPLTFSWTLAQITPQKVVALLNLRDPENRSWTFDEERGLPRFERATGEKEKRRRATDDLRQEAIRLYRLLWYPKLVEEAVHLAQAQLKAGHKISIGRRINNFYRPVYELQEEYANPPLLRYALQQTLDGPALHHPDTRSWIRYLAKVCANNKANFSGEVVPSGTNAAEIEASSLRGREMAVASLLRQAYELNRDGEIPAARALLSDILAQAKALAPLFNGDEKRADRALRLAFKQGSADILGVRPNSHSPVDYYPEWEWTEGAVS